MLKIKPDRIDLIQEVRKLLKLSKSSKAYFTKEELKTMLISLQALINLKKLKK